MNTLIEIDQRQAGDVLVFSFRGELDETNADKTFTNIYAAIGDFTGRKVVFNLLGLKYLNSKSIGYIADIYSNLEDNGGNLCLCNMGDDVQDTLELVGITSIVSVAENEAQAIERVGGQAGATTTPAPANDNIAPPSQMAA